MFKHRKILALCTAATIGLGVNHSAFAQSAVDDATGIADPGRIERDLIEGTLVPQGGPNIRVKELELQNAPEGSENIKFKFGGLQIDDANAYTQDELYGIYGDRIGTEISLAELYGIANQITLKYRNDGYILTQVIVPPQTIENGIARLRAVEGFIDQVSVQGVNETDSELTIIRQYAGFIGTGGALNIATMERQLLLINDLPGVSARSVISPSSSTPGAADLLIIVERDTFEASVGVNNFGTRFLGPLQFDGTAQWNSLLGQNEQITARFVGAPDSGFELAFFLLGYEQPVGPWGTTLSAVASVTETNPGFTLAPFEVEGLSRFISIEAEHPIIRSRNTNLSGRVSLDWRNLESQNNIADTIEDRIRAIRVGLRADFLDRLAGVAVNTIDIQYSQGIDVLGASDSGDADLTRSAGDPTFSKVNLQVQRLQRVANNVNLLLSGRAQLSNNPLLSSEEFGLGGFNTIRGFDNSEVIGDDGIAGRAELQWNVNKWDLDNQLFSFVDSGTIWNQDPATDADQRSSLTSVGFGVRTDLPYGIDAEFIATQPLHVDVQTQGDRDPRFFFSLNKDF